MTPHRNHGRGTLMIDRQFRGVGRICRASGTGDLKEFRAINALLSRLHSLHRSDFLAAVRDGLIHPLDLFLQVERKGLDSLDALASVAESIPARVRWERWCEETQVANTRKMYHLSWRYLERFLPADPTVGDLVPALVRLKAEMRDTAPTFNRTRASLQAFLKHTVGTKHEAYEALQGVPPLRERAKRREGIPIDRCIEIRDGLPADAAGAWWSLVTSGMRVGELCQENGSSWTVDGHAIVIDGSKTEHSARIVPLVVTPEATATADRLRRALSRDFPGVTPHVARYSFKALAIDAGIPETRVEQYLGHSTKGMAGLYGRVNLREWVSQDREMLLSYLAMAEQRRAMTVRGGLKRA